MQPAKFLNGTTSQLVMTGAGKFMGIIINSVSTGTYKIWDNTTATGTVLVNTFTPTASVQHIIQNGVDVANGLFITVTGTIDYTILYTKN